MVLDRVSFAVMCGAWEIACLQILMGFLKWDSERIIAAGEDITDYSEEQLERMNQVLFLDHSKILFYGTVGEMERSSEPLVQFLKDNQQEFHFSDEKEEKMAVGKEQQAGEVKVPRSKRRGD